MLSRVADRFPRAARLLGRPRARRWRRRLTVVAALLLVGHFAHYLIPTTPLRDRYPSSLAVVDAHHRLLRLTTASDDKYRLWTPLHDISPALVEATLLYEDQHFYSEFALNPWALGRAARSTFGGGRRIGGSTITMQLARRLFGIRSHDAWGKARQIAGALWLELAFSKDEILEGYLNLVSYGRNIEGVGAASRIYFGKAPRDLTPQEAITLAVVPQSPKRRAPGKGGDAQALAEARRILLARWIDHHPEAKRDEAALAQVPPSRAPEELPFLAPHFADAIVAGAGDHPAHAEIDTTLDLAMQRLVERRVRAYVAEKRRLGIRNAAVMLVDTRTMEVKALVGSADFRSVEISGQVDGTRARRSPGSALKPFVYALGLEQGVIHPRTMLKDAPTSFGAWAPENFDGRYVGPIAAEDALVRSRNVPALAIASKLNRPSFYDFLQTAGVGHLQPERHYGLALVLGGAEVTMEELATLYAALPNRGVLKPLRFRADDPPSDGGTPVLSPESSWVTLKMLEKNPRPDSAFRVAAADDRIPVAWKTGTSWGFRDAWTAGVFGPYVLVVWVGEFDNRSNPAFVGVQAAAPLFFDIVDGLEAERRVPDVARPQPPGVRRVEVCAVSGQLPSASCHHKVQTWFLPGRSPIDVCSIHRPVLVDDRTGSETCAPYGDGHSHSEVYEFWPSDMLKLFAQAGLPRRTPPPIDPRCQLAPEAGRSAPPQITSPLRGVTYTLDGDRRDDEIALQAVTDAAAREVYWFADRSFIGRSRAGTPLLWRPPPGRYTVRVVDDLGLADARPLKVELAR